MQTHGVDIRKIRILRGPNLYSYTPVIQVTIDIGPYEQRPSNTFAGFKERLVEWLPGLKKDECSLRRVGGFVERLDRGTYLAHICEHVALELQTLMGFAVTFGRARGTGERGVYNVVVSYIEAEPAVAAFETGLRLVLAAMHDEPFEVKTEIANLTDLADCYRLGPSTAAIVAAARKRDIPVVRLTPRASLIQLGYGKYQRRIQASETSNTSAIAVNLCQEKPLTNRILSMVGVPVPAGRSVKSEEEAWQVAQELKGAVVVKPEAGNQGKGVSVNLKSEAEIKEAYEIAKSFGRGDVLVETYIEGDDYRLLVVNGKMVAAARRDPAQVVGDGKQTITELVHEVNRDPRRRHGHMGSLTRIKLDEAVKLSLAQQNDMNFDSIPNAGQVVRLRQNCNLSTGGTATDVTDLVHPSNVRLAELAAQVLGLDIAGVDALCHDISRPIREQGGAVVEVNAAPGLRMHLEPAKGKSRQVGIPIIEMLYPANAPSRIPIIAVTGTNGKTTVTRLIAYMYETAHRIVGMTSTNGTYINGERIIEGDCSGPKSASAVLLHPHVEVAVLETARGGILREGLAFDNCSVGVVTNVSRDHLGMSGVKTVEDLAQVKQVVIEAVSRNGVAVLNADDPLVAEMAAATKAAVIYFGLKADNYIIAAHRNEGGRAVFAQDNKIILVTGQEQTELVDLSRVPFTLSGKIIFQVQNALAAVAATWATGLNPALIVRALTTFKTDGQIVPGRFNVTEIEGKQIVLDYGHNKAALTALSQGVKALGERKTYLVLGLPGDRQNEDLVATLEATFSFVDEYFMHDLKNRRGRAVKELPNLLKSNLPPNKFGEVMDSQHQAIEKAWRQMQPGERLVILADEADDANHSLQVVMGNYGEEVACLSVQNFVA